MKLKVLAPRLILVCYRSITSPLHIDPLSHTLKLKHEILLLLVLLLLFLLLLLLVLLLLHWESNPPQLHKSHFPPGCRAKALRDYRWDHPSGGPAETAHPGEQALPLPGLGFACITFPLASFCFSLQYCIVLLLLLLTQLLANHVMLNAQNADNPTEFRYQSTPPSACVDFCCHV